MARRHDDDGMLPWPRTPKNLETFIPGEFPDRQAWHAARLAMASSLRRPRLPEARGMVRVTRGRNGGLNGLVRR
jgi:hypothetical protein